MPHVIKIYGPPGTGKTTTINNIIKRMHDEESIDAVNFGYISFSRAAVDEERERALKLFGWDRKEAPWFRTQHSMNMKMLGLKSENIANMHMAEFCKTTKYRLSPDIMSKEKTRTTLADDTSNFDLDKKAPHDIYWAAYELARKKQLTLEQAQFLCRPVSSGYEAFVEAYEAWCREHSYTDFTGMITAGLDKELIPPVRVLCIDEFQDCCPLQVEQARFWAENIETVIIAGDPNQAIYTYAGADPKLFLDFPADETIRLTESHRLSKSHISFANKIIEKNKVRDMTELVSLRDDGRVIKVTSLPKLLSGIEEYLEKYPDKTWFLLSRNRWFVNSLIGEIKRRFLPVCLDKDLLAAVEFMTSDPPEFVTSAKLQLLLSPLFPSNSLWMYGQKKQIETLMKHPDFKGLPYKHLKEYNYLTPQFFYDHEIKSIAHLKVDAEDLDYIQKVRRKYPGKIPQIDVMTIHASKGKEADNVVLITDIVTRVHNSETSGDIESERRVWYVGATRQRDNLFYFDRPLFCNKKTKII